MAISKEKSKVGSRKRSSAAVSPTHIEQVKSSLSDLPQKHKEHLSLRETIDELFEPITSALAKGYGYDEIADVLGQNEIETTPSSLKYYFLRLRKERTTSTSTRKPRRTRQSVAAEPPAEPEEPVTQAAEPTEAPAPKKTTRRTSSSAAKTSATSASKAASRLKTSAKTTASKNRRKSS